MKLVEGKAGTLDGDAATLNGPERLNRCQALSDCGGHVHLAYRASRIFQFGVPIEEVTPAVRRVAQPDRDANGGHRFGTLRQLYQVHAGLAGCAAALPAIAGDTTCDDILPVLAATVRDRHDMVERELARGIRLATVLTRMVVAGVDVRSRERHVIE